MSLSRMTLAVVLLLAPCLIACSEEWVSVSIVTAYSDQENVVPNKIDMVYVEALASTETDASKSCRTVKRWFSHSDSDASLDFPIELVFTPSDSRDYKLIALRVTAYRGGQTPDNIVTRAEHFFVPSFDDREKTQVVLDERCHRENRGEVCPRDQHCVIDDSGAATCAHSWVQEVIDGNTDEIDANCDGGN